MANGKLQNILQQFSGDHKKLVKIIYRSEIKAPKMGVSVSDVMLQYTETMKKNPKNKKLIASIKQIIKRLNKGTSRWATYKGILPKDVISFLQEAEKKEIMPYMIFEKYAPIKQHGEKILAGVRRKLYVPFVIFAVALAGFNFMIGIFREIKDDEVIPFSDNIAFIMDNFLLMNISYGLIMAFFFLGVPHKLPMLKTVFNEINGMLALASLEVLSNISYSAGEMIPAIRRQFDLKYNPPKKSADGLVSLLYEVGFVDDLQASEIKMEAERGSIEDALSNATIEKRERIEGLNEVVQEIISKVSMFLLVVPLLMAISILLGLMSATGDIQ